MFHFYFKIDATAIDDLIEAEWLDDEPAIPNLPTGCNIYNGFWVTVDNAVADISNFNALTALQWYLTTNGWDSHFSNYGWIEDLLGLESYPGDGGVWYYWAQYHV